MCEARGDAGTVHIHSRERYAGAAARLDIHGRRIRASSLDVRIAGRRLTLKVARPAAGDGDRMSRCDENIFDVRTNILEAVDIVAKLHFDTNFIAAKSVRGVDCALDGGVAAVRAD